MAFSNAWNKAKPVKADKLKPNQNFKDKEEKKPDILGSTRPIFGDKREDNK